MKSRCNQDPTVTDSNHEPNENPPPELNKDDLTTLEDFVNYIHFSFICFPFLMKTLTVNYRLLPSLPPPHYLHRSSQKEYHLDGSRGLFGWHEAPPQSAIFQSTFTPEQRQHKKTENTIVTHVEKPRRCTPNRAQRSFWESQNISL